MNLIKKIFGKKNDKPCCKVEIKEVKEERCCTKK